MSLRQIINESNTPLGKAFDIAVQILIAVSIISFSLDTLPDLSISERNILANIEIVIILLFTIEYILRVVTAEYKIKFIFSFYGMIDLFAILPFYLSAGLDLRSLRMFRFLRLFQIFKIARYNQALVRLSRALRNSKEELVLFSMMTLFMLFMSAIGIYYFEHAAQPDKFSSIFDSLWWAVATLSTVGYGDIYPITTGGRLFTFVILMIGLGIIAVPAGIISSALSSTEKTKP